MLLPSHACRTILSSLLWAGTAAGALPLPDDPLERRCWLSHTAERTRAEMREPVSVHFNNLRAGDRVRAPFWVDFGVRGMGVIPVGHRFERAGHHHILVDTPLPADHLASIPLSERHKHFGKGQTGAALDLPPGLHTLRLLFADHEHRPYFVYSREIQIEVLGRRDGPAPRIDAQDFEASCAAWYQDLRSAPRPEGRAVFVKNLREGEPVASPFVLSLGVTGLSVAPAAARLKDSGHFLIELAQAGGANRRIELSEGRTEVLLDLPRGEHELMLRFVDSDGALLLRAEPLRLSVIRQDR